DVVVGSAATVGSPATVGSAAAIGSPAAVGSAATVGGRAPVHAVGLDLVLKAILIRHGAPPSNSLYRDSRGRHLQDGIATGNLPCPSTKRQRMTCSAGCRSP